MVECLRAIVWTTASSSYHYYWFAKGKELLAVYDDTPITQPPTSVTQGTGAARDGLGRSDADLLRLIAKDHARLAPNAHHSAECLRQIADRLTPNAAKSDAVEAMEAMAAQLGKAADQFAYYADEHVKKRTKDGDAKGMVNHQWALACAKAQGVGIAALATPTAPSDQADAQ